MTVVVTPARYPEPAYYDLRCNECGNSVLDEELPPYLDAGSAIEAHIAGKFAVVNEDGSWARCDDCVETEMAGNDEACDGSQDIVWNPSSNNDPQAELSAPCRGCPNCEEPS